MKFLELHLRAFGHFHDFALELDRDFALIYGPNEAGKTTLLHFIRGVLFGFEERTPYKFGDTEIGGRGVVRLRDGRRLELERRKGRGKTVQAAMDGKALPDFDDNNLQGLLSGANRTLYATAFAFGLEDVIAGEEGLRQDDLQAALFGSGLGRVADPQRILKELDDRAGELFKPNGRNPRINVLAAELGKLARQIKEHSVRSDDYRRLCREHQEAAGRSAELSAELARLRREQQHLQRLHRALPVWLRWQQLVQEQQRLPLPDGFPHDGGAQYQALQQQLQRLQQQQRAGQEAIDQLLAQRQQLVFDPKLLERQARISAAAELIVSVSDARRDLPEIQRELQDLLDGVQRRLEELKPDWSMDRLEAFRLGPQQRARLDWLADEGNQLRVKRASLSERRDEQRAEIERLDQELAGLQTDGDLQALSALLEHEAAYRADQTTLRKVQQELARVEKSLETAVRRLSPPMPPGAAWRDLPVPRLETVSQAKASWTDLHEQHRSEAASLSEAQAKLAELEQELAQLVPGQDIPSREALQALRQQRDALWQALCEPPRQPQEAPADRLHEYRRLVAAADEYADRIYALASAVAKRELVQQQRAVVERKQQAVADLAGRLQQFAAQWRTCWAPCGLDPLEPPAMESWCQDFRRTQEIDEQLQSLRGEQQVLVERCREFEARLRKMLGQSAPQEASALLSAVRTRHEAALQTQQRRRQYEDTLQRLRTQEAQLAQRLSELDQRQQQWAESAAEALRELNLPENLPLEAARQMVSQLHEARIQLERVPGYRRRIADMQKRLDAFAPQVEALCNEAAEDLRGVLPEVAARLLHQRLGQSEAASQECKRLDQALEIQRQHLQRLQEELDTLHQRRAELLRRAAAHDEAQFLQVARTAQRRLEVEQQADQLHRELRGLAHGEDWEAFQAQLQQTDAAAFETRLDELASQLQQTQAAHDQAVEHRALLGRELEQLDTASQAALLRQEEASRQAELADAVEQYVPLVLARHLFQQAIQRFEREHQPAMMAGISEIFRHMTHGRYVRVERPLGAETGLVVRRHDGAMRQPRELSAGSREQLYLAIRLAYVLEYCRKNEPLPLVIDDVLANFDDRRARRTLAVLRDVSAQVQVLFFTCHQHLVELARQELPDLEPVVLPAVEPLNELLHDPKEAAVLRRD